VGMKEERTQITKKMMKVGKKVNKNLVQTRKYRNRTGNRKKIGSMTCRTVKRRAGVSTKSFRSKSILWHWK
jgi:hypothetical protein